MNVRFLHKLPIGFPTADSQMPTDRIYQLGALMHRQIACEENEGRNHAYI